MGNEKTKFGEQEIFNYAVDDLVKPPLLTVGVREFDEASQAWVRGTTKGKTIKTVTGSLSATATLVAAVSSKRIKVVAIALFTLSTTVVTVTMKSGAGGTALWTVPLQAITGTVFGANLAIPAPSFLFATAAGSLLELAVSAAQTVYYNVSYFDDDGT